MPILLKIDPGTPDEKALAEAVRILRGEGVVAYPTETFYGLGVDASRESAVEKIFLIKGRNFRNPVSVIIDDDRKMLPLVTEIPDAGKILMRTFWPGPLTLVFQAAPFVSSRLTGGSGKIGIRVSSHPLARLLTEGLSGPLTATSANPSGGPECITAEEVVRTLGTHIDAVIDGGPTPGGAGSTILDLTTYPPLILREGAIARADIFAALGIPAP